MELEDIKTIQLRSPVGYLAFPELFEAVDKWKTGKPKFSCTLMVPKEMSKDSEDLWNDLHKTILKYGVAEFGASAVKKSKEGSYTPTFALPIVDGDETDYEGNRGYWIIRASANEKFPPKVLDPDNEEITEPSPLTKYGVEAEFLLGLYYYKYQGKTGLSLNLLAVRCLGGEGMEQEPVKMATEEAVKAFGAKPALLGGSLPQIEADAPKVDISEVEEFLTT